MWIKDEGEGHLRITMAETGTSFLSNIGDEPQVPCGRSFSGVLKHFLEFSFLSHSRQMQEGGLKLHLFGDCSALGMPWSWPLDQLTRLNANSLACLGLGVVFPGTCFYLCMAVGPGTEEERTAFSLDSPAHCHASLTGKWGWKLMLELNSHAIKRVFLFFSAYIFLGSLRREFVGRQDSRISDALSWPNIIFSVSSCHVMIYGPQKLRRQNKEFGHRTRMSATNRTIEIKKNCSFTFSHSKKINILALYNMEVQIHLRWALSYQSFHCLAGQIDFQRTDYQWEEGCITGEG